MFVVVVANVVKYEFWYSGEALSIPSIALMEGQYCKLIRSFGVQADTSWSPQTDSRSSCMEGLAHDLLAQILVKVPLGKCKIQMQLVSKMWRDVLHQPSAHSMDTWTDDEFLSGPLSAGIANAVVGYKFDLDEVLESLAWLPPKLQALYVPKLVADCPTLPNLDLLRLGEPCSTAASLSQLFPHLEEINLGSAIEGVDDLEWDSEFLQSMLDDLGGHQNVRLITVESRDFANFEGNPECKVVYTIDVAHDGDGYEREDPLKVPAGLAKHLQQFKLGRFTQYGGSVWRLDCERFSLDFLSDCTCLESVHIVTTGGDEYEFDPYREVRMSGLEDLPKSCEEVVLFFTTENPLFQKVIIKPAFGWLIYMPSPFFVQCTREESDEE